MANARHGDQNPTDGDGLHVLHNFEPANAAALAALAVVAADIGKVARQVDTGDFYMLRSVGPSVWDKINGSGTGDVVGPASSIDDRLALFDGVTGKLLKQGTVTGSAVATHLPDTANPHATDLGNIGSGTLAELNTAVTDATLDDASDPRTPTAHASTHENGGGDEINVGGLSGLLADGQTPLGHASTHENGGGDEISVAGLSGLLADAQNPTAHASTHSDGGSDEISVEDLATAELNAALVLKPDGAGGLVFGAVGGTGDVVGPASAVDDRLALFDGVTGKLIKQGTVTGAAVAAHLTDTANPHDTDVGNLGSGTLAELNAAITDATLDDASDPRTPTAHAATHENGGGDEINVAGLSGLLADGQTPTAHASTHENGGGDEISVAGLSGLLADAQTPTAHASTHSDGGSDEITVEDLATASTTLTHVLSPDGAGGLLMRAEAGGAAITTTSINWVDKAGNDGTATADRFDLPWLTIGAALTGAASGDTVIVRPGNYVESGLTIPAGVSLIGEGGFRVTTIGDAAAVAHVITLSDGSYLQGFAITVPTTASVAGVAHSTGTGTVYDLDFRGDGLTGSGDGLVKTGAGKVVGGNIRCSLGGMANLLRVSAAVLALDDVHVPQSAGTIGNVTLTEGGGRFQGQAHNVGNSNVGDCIHVAGTSTCIIYSPNWFNVPIGGHLAADGVTVTIVGGRVDATGASLLIDPALTGVGTTLVVSGTTVQPLFSFPSAAIGAMQLNATFHQELTDVRNAESRVVGSDMVTGFPELGSALLVGEGSSYSDGIKVITTDGTETMVGSVVTGGSQVDETAAAQSRSGSTLTFQGVGVGNAIYFASSRETTAGAALKHWGAKVAQVAAGVDGSYVIEIWDGAAWVGVGVQASSEVETYRYSSDVFLRAASSEFLQYGIDTDTTWGLATADGAGVAIGASYWVRWRITSTVTTLPTFETAWLAPSHVQLNELGRRRALGLALWRQTLIIGGNVYGESGGVQSANILVGSGGLPTGWTQNAPNSRLNTTGDAIYTQLVLPEGLCTAFPLKITPVYSVEGSQPVTTAPTGIVSVLPIQVQGVSVADPSGGIVPVPRTLANTDTLTANAGQAVGPTALTDTATTDNRALSTVFSPFEIDGLYGGDLVMIRFEFENDGSPNQDLTMWTLILEGVAFSDGGVL